MHYSIAIDTSSKQTMRGPALPAPPPPHNRSATMSAMSATSEQLNYLIWRYLQEAGHAHTTRVFEAEAAAGEPDSALADRTPVGLLVSVFQKGLQYMEIERLVRADGELADPAAGGSAGGARLLALAASAAATAQEDEDAIAIGGPRKRRLDDVHRSHDNDEEDDDDDDDDEDEDDEGAGDNDDNDDEDNGDDDGDDDAVAVEADHLRHAPKTKFEPVPIDSEQKSKAKREADTAGATPSEHSTTASEDIVKRVKTSHTRTHSIANAADLFHKRPVPLPPLRLHVSPLPDSARGTDSTWATDGSRLALTNSRESNIAVYAVSATGTGSSNGDDGEMRMQTAAVVSIPSRDDEVCCVALTSDGGMLCAGTFAGSVHLWDITVFPPKLKTTFSGFHTAPVMCARFLATPSLLLIVTIDCLRHAAVWDCSPISSTKGPVRVLSKPPSSREADAVDEDNASSYMKDSLCDIVLLHGGADTATIAITTGVSGEIDTFSIPLRGTGSLVASTAVTAPSRVLRGHSRVVNVLQAVSLSPSAPECLMSGSDDSSVRIWDMQTRTTKIILEGHNAGVISMKLCSSRPILASGDLAGRLRIWDLRSGAMVGKVEYSYPIFAFDIINVPESAPGAHQTGIRVLTGSKDGVLNAWDVADDADGSRLSARSLEKGLGGITAIQTSPDGRSTAVTGTERTCMVYYS
ncbi:WD40-repeat-containing domain protein [Limtongia smithiae]|uniref:WD40-repeat-containing domain protein n=1 Tax=Limtongia smithiae TaxID=1125753 RepID=UPI0034CED106